MGDSASTEILKEALKFLFRNGKLLSFINRVTSLYSLYFMFIIIPLGSFIFDLLFNQKSPLGQIAILVWISSFAYFSIMLFSVPATIVASSIIHCCDNISLKDFLSNLVYLWMRPFVTYLYTTLFTISYTVLSWAILASVMEKNEHSRTSQSVLIVFLFLVLLAFYLYLDVVWTLGLVVAVMEERLHGKDAIGKASRLVEGRKLLGFALNLFFMLLYIVFYQGFNISTFSLKSQKIIGYLASSCYAILSA